MKNKITKRSVKCFIVIVGVVIIPLLYSYFYLGAFWDPYSKLETLPIAVVNNDNGATINDVERNLGQEMCDRLKEDGSLKFVFTDEKTAKTGTEGSDYYAEIVIPENFSKNIASASTTEKQTATISYSPNQKSNFLASQILSRAVLEVEEETRSNINAELVDTLADKLRDVPNQMADLQDGMNELYDGSSDLKDGTSDLKNGTSDLKNGTNDLANGTKTFQSKMNEYKDGVADAAKGSKDLKDGAVTLDAGINELLAGANKLTASTKNINQLTEGSKTLAAGAKQFNDSLVQYTAGVDTLISTVNSTSTFLGNYATKVNPAIMKDPVFAAFMKKMSDPANAESLTALKEANAQLKTASTQIATGAQTLSDGTATLPQLKTALSQLSTGLTQAKEGSAALAEGSNNLYSGLNTINGATVQLSTAAGDISDGAAKLNDGAVKLNDGAIKLDDGAVKLNNGLEEAKTAVDDSITDANDEIASLDGLSDFAKAPVNIEETDIYPVPNYGTAFTPYFLSLSLWVGALIMFFGIYLDADARFKILSRESKNKVARSFCYLLIGLTQAIVLGLVVQFALGLKIVNIPLFYAACCLVSMVDIAIVQFCLVHLKDLGKFVAIALLILQLTSCGGTFPMETIPKMFSYLYPFMPMTYAVALFKNAISGVKSSEVVFNGGVLCAILIVFMALTVMLSLVKFRKEERAKVLVEETI